MSEGMEHDHCGQESERPVLTPALERKLKEALAFGRDRLDDPSTAHYLTLKLEYIIRQLGDPDHPGHLWECDYDGEGEVTYWPLNGNTLRRATEFRRVWTCPWCESTHKSTGHQYEFDGTL